MGGANNLPIVRPIGPERPRGNLSGRNPSAPIGPRYAQGQPYGPRRGAPDNPAAYRGGRFYRAGYGPRIAPALRAQKKGPIPPVAESGPSWPSLWIVACFYSVAWIPSSAARLLGEPCAMMVMFPRDGLPPRQARHE